MRPCASRPTLVLRSSRSLPRRPGRPTPLVPVRAAPVYVDREDPKSTRLCHYFRERYVHAKGDRYLNGGSVMRFDRSAFLAIVGAAVFACACSPNDNRTNSAPNATG